MTGESALRTIAPSLKVLNLGLCEIPSHHVVMTMRNLRHLNLGCINLPSLNDCLEGISQNLLRLETLRISGQILTESMEPIRMMILKLKLLSLLDLTHVDIYLPCSSPKKYFPWEEVIKAKRLRHLILVGAFQSLPLIIPHTVKQMRPDLDIFADRIRFDVNQIQSAKKLHKFDINALIAPYVFSDHTYLGRALATRQSHQIIEGILNLGAEVNCEGHLKLLKTVPHFVPMFLKYGSHLDVFYQSRLSRPKYEFLLEFVNLNYSQWEKLVCGKYLDPSTLEFLLSRIPSEYLDRLRPKIKTLLLEEFRKKARFTSIERISILLQYGAEIDVRDPNKKNGLILILETSEYEFLTGRIENTINLLLQKGINVNAQDMEGNTPLHVLCRKKHSNVTARILSTMLRHGANPRIQNPMGVTAYEYAVECPSMLQVLQDFELAESASPRV